MTVGEHIKDLRTQKGLTQKKLAELCGLATGTIQQYELEKRKPKIETLHKIAAALDVPISKLYDSILEFPESRSEIYGAHITYLVYLIESGPCVLSKTAAIKLLKEMKQCLHEGGKIEDADEAHDFFDSYDIKFSHEFLREMLKGYKNQSVNNIVGLLSYYLSLTSNAQGKIREHVLDLYEVPIYRNEK